MNRRNFLGLLGLTGAAAVPVVANASEPRKPPKLFKDDQFFTPYVTLNNNSTEAKVDIAVGEDNHLWVRPKGSDWKRLKVE